MLPVTLPHFVSVCVCQTVVNLQILERRWMGSEKRWTHEQETDRTYMRRQEIAQTAFRKRKRETGRDGDHIAAKQDTDAW